MKANEAPEQYIPKSAVVAEIEKLMTPECSYSMDKLLDNIDSLEVKEVDLGAELNKWRHNHFHGRRDKEASGEYLERVTQLGLAKYFFELGMAVSNKAQKERSGMTDKEKRELKNGVISIFKRFNILDHTATIGGLRDDILRYINSLQEEPVSEEQVKESTEIQHEDRTCKENGNSLTQEPTNKDFEMALAEMVDKAQKCVVEPLVVAEQWKDELIKLAKSEEPVSESIDFEQELYKAFGQIKDFTLGVAIAKRFYNMGRKHNEPVSEELEESAVEWFNSVKYKSDLSGTPINAFKAGAEWQKEQFEKNRLKHCNSITNEQAELEQGFIDQHLDKHQRMPTFLDAIEYGMRLQKEQMMANATEVTVHIDAGGYPYIPQIELYDYDKDIPLAKEGDKYKVVLIKED